MAERQTEVIGRGVALRDGAVLLCKSLDGGYFYLPGGHVEFGERAREATEREFLEETGLGVRATDLVLVTEASFVQKKPHHEITLVFLVEHAAGAWPHEIKSAEDHLGFEWVDLGAIVDLDVRPPSQKAWLVTGGGGPSPRARADWASDIQA